MRRDGKRSTTIEKFKGYWRRFKGYLEKTKGKQKSRASRNQGQVEIRGME